MYPTWCTLSYYRLLMRRPYKLKVNVDNWKMRYKGCYYSYMCQGCYVVQVLSLKRQLQTTNEPSETTTPSSLSTVTGYKPLSSYSLYGTATTSSTSFLHTYPSTLSYYGNSSYTTGSSYTYSSQPNYGGLLLGKSESSSQSQPTSSYGFMLTTSSEISGLNFGHSYQTAITTTSPVLTSTSSKPVTTVTTKNRNQVTMDTMEKDKNRQQGFQSTEATLVLPGLVDSTKMSFQTQPKPITSQGE